MSKLLANQIANYNDNGPVEVKEGIDFPAGKPLQAAGAAGSTGDYLKSTGTGIAWESFPTIPSAQVQSDWNATSGMGVVLNKPSFSPVAVTGDYNDLSNKPTIPSAQINSDWSATSGVERILNKPTLFSGSYSDLTNRPVIPATITDLAGVNLPNPIPDGAYIQWDTATTKWIVGSGSQGIMGLLEDTSPQLGGNLDANGFYIDMGNLVITDAKVGEWNTAYSWGNHATEGYIKTFTNTTYSQAAVGDAVGVKLRLTDSFGVQDDILITAGTGITIDNIGTQGFRLNSSGGGGGGGATVTTDDNAPATPSDGDMWWKSDEGRLKIFYSDINGSQWVDASPPLSPAFAPKVSNGTVELEAASEGTGNIQNQFLKMTGHLLPSAHQTYDIGSADKKIRHLFLSDNSIWVGDDMKMSNHKGKVKFYTRDTSKVPTAVANAGGSIAGCITFVGTRFPARGIGVDASNSQGNGLFISDWLAYLCDLTNAPEGTFGPEDLWPPETILGDNNPDYNFDDWSNAVDLVQDGKNQAIQINADAEEYKLWESQAFLRTSALADFPVKVIGSTTVDKTYVDFTIFLPQGNTPRTMTSLSIDGDVATQLKITGTPEANVTNTFDIKAIYFGGEWKATVVIG